MTLFSGVLEAKYFDFTPHYETTMLRIHILTLLWSVRSRHKPGKQGNLVK